MRPIIVGMHEAKTHFSKLVRRAADGQEVIVANAGRPVARIVAYEPVAATRAPGLLAGRIVIKPGFDELPPGFEQAFGGR
jgi:prevent-host-death family protein